MEVGARVVFASPYEFYFGTVIAPCRGRKSKCFAMVDGRGRDAGTVDLHLGSSMKYDPDWSRVVHIYTISSKERLIGWTASTGRTEEYNFASHVPKFWSTYDPLHGTYVRELEL